MPGKVDETKWSEAKAAARKQYPSLDDKNPRLWKVVSTIYKKMGGEFSEGMQKSLAAIEAAERVTPSFIEDPRLWVSAVKKSCPNMRWGINHLGIIMKSYAEAGGRLLRSSMSDFIPTDVATSMSISEQFEKGGGTHKYVNRVPKPGGGWRYIYSAAEAAKQGSGGGKAAPKAPAAKQGGANPSAMARIVESLGKKTAAAQRAALQNVTDENLERLGSHAGSQPGLKKVIAEEKDRRRVEAAKKQADAKQKTEKSQGADIQAFSEAHYDEVKSALQKSHPDWDSATLIERTDAQIRQMFKMRG